MGKRGVADLPLHGGKAPPWLILRMRKLAKEIVSILIREKGEREFLRKISDPYWFQAFGCVLGYDWHSSGLTTVVTGVLREALNESEIGIKVAGGKGKRALSTLNDIERLGEELGLTSIKIDKLKYASRMAAKVDNVALQDGFTLYHHVILFTEDGDWAVVQQGMNEPLKYARRYHWLSDKVVSFVREPHLGIVSDRVQEMVLNMVDERSEGARRLSVDLINEGPLKLRKSFRALKALNNRTLNPWLGKPSTKEYIVPTYLLMPRRIDWDLVKSVYEWRPKDYEELLSIKGVGASLIRALALISQLIYGEDPSWEDPVKYSFAFGGKDGVPYPVDIKTMDEAITFLEEAIKATEVEREEKLKALKRLYILSKSYIP